MQPASLQHRLQAIYDLDCRHRIEDFLLTDRGTAQALAGDGALGGSPEALLVRQEGEDLGVSLYLDEHLLDRLTRLDPAAGLDAARTNDLLALIEGVSHFLYLIWNAGHARPVTQLEMELQAEVDKFVTWALLLDGDPRRSDWDAIHDALFRRWHLRGELSEAQRTRYRHASALAGRYCRALMRRLARPGSAALLPELRRFYRMPHGRKIRHIQALPS